MKRSYKNKLSELDSLREDLECFFETNDIGEDVRYAVNLCLEEILTNIVSYGYKDRREHGIDLDLTKAEDFLVAVVRDDGIPFDPLKYSARRELDSSLADRSIGGLGIHILKKFMDQIKYRREGVFNVLILEKNLLKTKSSKLED